MSALATAAAPASFAPPASREILNAECLACIISGRPLPAGVQARIASASRPASVSAGIEGILGGPAA